MHILTNMVLQVYNYFPTYPTTQTKANQPERRTGRTTILIVLLGGVALTKTQTLHHLHPKVKWWKKHLYPELRQHPLWTIGLLIFPTVFVLPISTWWPTTHVTHVALTWPSGREKEKYKWLKSPIWQFCWWPFWDGENKWPFQRWIVTSNDRG